MATGIIAALIHRERSGEGQDVSLAIHEAVSKNPEQDLMYWVCRRGPLVRVNCPPAAPRPHPPAPEVDLRARQVPGTAGADEARSHMLDIVQRFVRAWTYKDMPWREAQDAGLLWAPLRKPHENALDEHWRGRNTFAEVEHPELGRSFPYPTSKWLSNKTSWQVGRRAPLLGEDTKAVLGEAARRPSVPA